MVLKLSRLAGMFAPRRISTWSCLEQDGFPLAHPGQSCLQAEVGAGGRRSVQPCREQTSHENLLSGTEKLDSSVPRL